MKTQKSAVLAVLLAILAASCLFTACGEQEPEPRVETPSASPQGGSQPSAPLTVTLTTQTAGATIRYTLNGAEPTTSSTPYLSAITISETTMLKAFATKSGWKDSSVLTVTYTMPENRTEKISLGDMTAENSGWQQLVASIYTARKYVHLDLSACTMSGTEFNPTGGRGDSHSGKSYIVSLILPTAATSIADRVERGDFLITDDAFDDFYNLQSISGANITKIGSYAFNGRGKIYSDLFSGLQSVDFPKATSLGNFAFGGCSELQSVAFPQVTTIGNNAFGGCTSLQSGSFPQVTTIGDYAFSGCNSLQSVNLPKVTSIGSNVFAGNITTALVITMGSSAPTLGGSIVEGRTATVTTKVPANATGYSPFAGSTAATVSGTNTDTNWANGLRGGGWTGSTWASSLLGGTNNINKDITLTIQQQ
jgi:hypothetical protein